MHGDPGTSWDSPQVSPTHLPPSDPGTQGQMGVTAPPPGAAPSGLLGICPAATTARSTFYSKCLCVSGQMGVISTHYPVLRLRGAQHPAEHQSPCSAGLSSGAHGLAPPHPLPEAFPTSSDLCTPARQSDASWVALLFQNHRNGIEVQLTPIACVSYCFCRLGQTRGCACTLIRDL